MTIASTITGTSLIGGAAVMPNGAVFRAVDPASGNAIEPDFYSAGSSEIEQACSLAQQAFDTYRESSQLQRAQFLEAIGAQIHALGDALIERAMAETGLPRARLEGERGRTVAQLQLFADLVRQGAFIDVRHDSALPLRQPPRPALAMRRIAIGPVAVFGASNFPLAFSVAGGDTAAALAAGCPVIVKAHPAHPGTSELVGRAIVQALASCGLPSGVFAMLCGSGNALGSELVAHPVVQAVGFTGSRQGGLALLRIAAQRAQPIPVYAEMSSINPVLLLPHALRTRGASLATGLATSLTLGAGQFCTNPGLVLGLRGEDFNAFGNALQAAIAAQPAQTMLTAAIAQGYQRGVTTLAQQPGVQRFASGATAHADGQAVAAVFRTTADQFASNPLLREEIFGPATLLVACDDLAQMRQLLEGLEGHLTATMQMDDHDLDAARSVLPILERKVGRILVNGYPTGVEVADSMVHGGPFPATSDGRSTSVGSAAIERFLRPVCYQNLPQDLLPIAIQDGNPLGLRHRRDGAFAHE